MITNLKKQNNIFEAARREREQREENEKRKERWREYFGRLQEHKKEK